MNRMKGNGANMLRKKLPALLLVLSLLLTMTVVPAFAQNNGEESDSSGYKTYSDVPSTHWAFNAISWMTSHGILNGKGNNRFDPEAAITREQFARIMVVALQLKTNSDYSPSFSDVAKNSWSFKFVEAAKIYLTGWKNTTGGLDFFKPYDVAVREDMAVALVKALKLDGETPDTGVLAAFTDALSISPNLQKYVAIAVKHGIINGIGKPDGTKTFDAQGTLTRAQASVLVYNALVSAGDKVTYDDLAKVTYNDPSVVLAGTHPATTVAAIVVGDKLHVTWDRINAEGFQGYKVVLSKADSTPVYPENGYQTWITNRDQTSVDLKAGTCYNGGDIGGTLKGETPYYLSITAVYDDMKIKVPGNVLTVTLPKGPEPAALPGPTAVRVESGNGHVTLHWNKITDERFQGYKVVLSKGDSTPRYSENGYLAYITDCNTDSYEIEKGLSYNDGDFGDKIVAGTYYAAITVLYKDDQRITGNVVTLTIPE